MGDLLAVATSTGQVVFYRLDPRSDGDLVLASTKSVADSSMLVLSLAWHPLRARVLGFTLSDGSVCLCESTEGELWSEEAILYQTTVHRHDLEAWTVAFSCPSSTNVLSGGDDGILQYSTINGHNKRQIQWEDRKLHNAGVTAILPLTSTLVVTGSYDDNIRLISFPQTGRRHVLAEANLGGGVWRLKTLSSTALPAQEGEKPEITRYVLPTSTHLHDKRRAQRASNAFPSCHYLPFFRLRLGFAGGPLIMTQADMRLSLVVLASCMHAGSRVVKLCKGENGDWEWEFGVLARFEEHRSMNYGADFQPDESGTGKRVVSISFYDKLLCLWRFEEDAQ